MTNLISLAERMERLAGPCRDTDGWIYATLNPDAQTVTGHKEGRFPRDPIYGPLADVMEGIGGKDGADYIMAPAYTASIEAAMTLIPEGHWLQHLGRTLTGWRCLVERQGYSAVAKSAATPALALLSACLRSLARMKEEE